MPKAVSEFFNALCELILSDKSIQEVFSLFMLEKAERKEKISCFKQLTWQLAGLTTLCDWIASGDEAFEHFSDKWDLKLYYGEACQKAETAVKRAEVIPALLSKEQGMRRLFPQFADSPTPLQKFCNETPVTGEPQLWILEDVTGAGKTEAALTLASRILGAGGGTGCFIALPTMATSNAMYERMAEVYSCLYEDECRPSLTLSHGSRHLSDTFRNSYRDSLLTVPHNGEISDEDRNEGKAHCSQWLADSSKKALLADVGVGTVDQILMAGLPIRYQSLRAFGMSQKVLIVDEVHAFDAYMLRLLENIITAQAAFGGSVILLSATLPFSVREKFCNAFSTGLRTNCVPPRQKDVFPLVTSVTARVVDEKGVETRRSVAREVDVNFCENIDDVYELIERSVREEKCVCWIRNTITDVTASFDELQRKGVVNLDMFHSRFALNDRLNIEKRVLKRFGKDSTSEERKSQVLVASQVVEQSLDLDFDVMISDLAPIDLLIQRAGRLHRHEREKREKPGFYVHTPKDTEEPSAEWYAESFPNAQWVYKDTSLLWRTNKILKKQKQLKMPEEARLLIESVYGEEEALDIPDVFIGSEDESWANMMSKKSLADFNRLKFEQGYCRMSSDMDKWESNEKVSTRLSDETNTIYLCRWDGEKVISLYNDELYSWDLSSLSLRKSGLTAIQYDDAIQKAIDVLKEQKRFMYNTLFLVFSCEEMVLYGSDERDREVVVRYSRDRGLTVKNEEIKAPY
jgi:CRISPR-associated endonuclease/helicase Cas3